MENFREDFKETIQRLSKSSAKTKGDILKITVGYLEKIGKKEVIPQIGAKMVEYGYPLKPDKTKTMEWYPIAMEMALFFALVEVLGWGENEIKAFGRNFVKLSFIGRIMIKYFLSRDKTLAQVSKIWRSQMDSGQLEIAEINEEKHYLTLKLKDFDLHPLYCVFLSGLFEKLGNYIPRGAGKKILCQESECTFKGGRYHEFVLRLAE